MTNITGNTEKIWNIQPNSSSNNNKPSELLISIDVPIDALQDRIPSTVYNVRFNNNPI